MYVIKKMSEDLFVSKSGGYTDKIKDITFFNTKEEAINNKCYSYEIVIDIKDYILSKIKVFDDLK